MGAYSQNCVQKKHSLLRPLLQIAVIGDIASTVIMKLLINIHQGRWRLHSSLYGKTKPMSLPVIMIGILTQNHYLHFIQRCKMKCIKQIIRRRKNLPSLIFCHHRFI